MLFSDLVESFSELDHTCSFHDDGKASNITVLKVFFLRVSLTKNALGNLNYAEKTVNGFRA